MAITIRPAGEPEIPAIVELYGRSNTHDLQPHATAREEIADAFAAPGFVADDDARVAVGSDGLVVGFAGVWYRSSGDRDERVDAIGTVDPDWRRQGVGSALLAWQLDRGAAKLRTLETELPRFVRAYAYDWLADHHRLYERHGMTLARYFEKMLRPLDGPLPDVQSVAGVRIVPWDPDREEEVRRVHNDSLLGKWGTPALDTESWDWFLNRNGSRGDLSFLAVSVGDGEVIGYTRNGVYAWNFGPTGRKEGWIEGIGVHPEWRGQGVATALVARSMQAFVREGLTHAALAVDAESPSGAPHLYRRVGFEPVHRTRAYQLRVD